jgi:hypothetical protein
MSRPDDCHWRDKALIANTGSASPSPARMVTDVVLTTYRIVKLPHGANELEPLLEELAWWFTARQTSGNSCWGLGHCAEG